MSVIDPTVPHVQAPRRALATGILIFAAFMDLIDVTIVNVALPSIRDDLQATPAHLEWVLSGYTLTFAVLLITGGRLGDNFGRRTMFLLGVGGFTLASLGACLASNGDMLVVARVVQGGFAAMMVPQMLSSVQVLYAPRERAAVFGVVGAVSGTAAVIGPLLGGWLITHDAFGIGWRSIFLINIPVGLVILVLALDVRAQHVLGDGEEDRPARRTPGERGAVPAGLPADRGPQPGLVGAHLADARGLGRADGAVRRGGASYRAADRFLAAADAPVRQPRLQRRTRHPVGLPGIARRVLARDDHLRAGRARVQRLPRRA